MGWISLALEAIKYGINHRKEIAQGAEVGIHVLRRIEHLCVKHKTTADDILMHADAALHEYNTKMETEPVAMNTSVNVDHDVKKVAKKITKTMFGDTRE